MSSLTIVSVTLVFPTSVSRHLSVLNPPKRAENQENTYPHISISIHLPVTYPHIRVQGDQLIRIRVGSSISHTHISSIASVCAITSANW
ncbi:hypothetical protein O3P69_016532 [Scylla paramamosain]|uniref:Secreted protein n=1 Tax=Scylla paramamosain TaxID=85552 RepID=A0AAW0TE13_SCYPA